MNTTTATPRLKVAVYATFFLVGWNLVLLPALVRSLLSDYVRSDTDFGVLLLVGAGLYTIGALTSGYLVDRLGRRIVLGAALVAYPASLCAMVASPDWTLMIIFSTPSYWAVGILEGGINGLFLDMHRSDRGRAMNRLHLYVALGALTGPLVVGGLSLVHVGWQPILLGTALFAIITLAGMMTATMPSGRGIDLTGSAIDGNGSGGLRVAGTLIPFVGLAAAINLYIAAELAVSNWVVRLLDSNTVASATLVLAVYWAGLGIGRLSTNWFIERMNYYTFTYLCITASALFLLAAVAILQPIPQILLFGLVGVCYGPVYPTIVAIGGELFPDRPNRISSALSAAGVSGSLFYPPLMGLIADTLGLRIGMIGATLLAIPIVLSLNMARRRSPVLN